MSPPPSAQGNGQSRARLWLVTGGCGFIGSHLVDALLDRGDAVHVLDDLSTGSLDNLDPRVRLIEADVADPEAVRKAMEGCAGCFHLAAVASVERCTSDWMGAHRTNLAGSVATFNAARERRIPVVYASSAAVYGDAGDPPYREFAPARPLSAYGADKLGSELHARAGAVVHGLSTAGLRFFNVYGPRQDPASPYSGVISIFCDRLRSGKAIAIHGDGAQTRDFISVEDVVYALLLAMDRMPDGASVFNVCTGKATSILELAAAVAEAAGSELETVSRPARRGDVRASVGDPVLACRRIGFKARIDLREGLRRLVAASTKDAPLLDGQAPERARRSSLPRSPRSEL